MMRIVLLLGAVGVGCAVMLFFTSRIPCPGTRYGPCISSSSGGQCSLGWLEFASRF